MRIRLSELRRIIRNTIKENYGWPVESESHLYGAAPSKIDVENPRDPKNSALKLPKGPNSRTKVNESFQRITARELSAWKTGNYDHINEAEETQDPCEECGEMKNSGELSVNEEGKYLCQGCSH